MKRGIVTVVACMLLAAGTDVRSEEKGWRTEFDAICGQTENTVDMTVADLRAALARCDRLRESIDRLEPTPRKVYQKRLQMCRNLLEYMLETKLKQGGQ